MKKLLVGLSLLALFVIAGCDKGRHGAESGRQIAGARTFSSFDLPKPGDKLMPAQGIKLEQADLTLVLNLYAEVSGRSVIRGTNLPDVKITFSNQTPMSTVEVLRALDTVLAAQGITTVMLGTEYVKVVPAKDAAMEPGPVIELPLDQLPDSSSFLIYIVKLKKVSPMDVAKALGAFAKLPNSIIVINPDGGQRLSKSSVPNPPVVFGNNKHGILILRDYSSNVRRMLQVLKTLEQE
jgi:type II secretory pathway component GspD/PulD (secretin)